MKLAPVKEGSKKEELRPLAWWCVRGARSPSASSGVLPRRSPPGAGLPAAVPGDPPAFCTLSAQSEWSSCLGWRLPWKPACSGALPLQAPGTTESPPCWPGAPALTRQEWRSPDRQAQRTSEQRAPRHALSETRRGGGIPGCEQVLGHQGLQEEQTVSSLTRNFWDENAVHAKLDKYVRIRKRIANEGLRTHRFLDLELRVEAARSQQFAEQDCPREVASEGTGTGSDAQLPGSDARPPFGSCRSAERPRPAWRLVLFCRLSTLLCYSGLPWLSCNLHNVQGILGIPVWEKY